jgi:hypothetical protein
MLTQSTKRQLLTSLKKYHRQYLNKLNSELDESATRLMINSFLTEVLGYTPIEDVKTEYMIRGTYADYVVKIKDVQHFLVEVKALGIELSEKHLRQAIHYGADEGIDWALLTNGKQFDFYKILYGKPINERKVFSIDLSDYSKLKMNMETIQYLHKRSVTAKGLNHLWNKCIALDPTTIAGLLHNKPILNFIKRALKKRYKHNFTFEEVGSSIDKIIYEQIQLEDIKQRTIRRKKGGKKREHKRYTPKTTEIQLAKTNITLGDNSPIK